MKYFGTDGFRGKAGKVLTAEHAFHIGRFIGAYYGGNRKMHVVIGKDTRLSSYCLEYALAAGIASSGGYAYTLHVTTTACISFIVRTEGFDYGIMISASHNGYADNGIKIFNKNGEKVEDLFLSKLEEYLDCPQHIPYATDENVGKAVDYISGRNRYIGHIISLSECSFKGYKVGLDCANGSAWEMAKCIFNALGAETVAVGNQPNGLNINKDCGCTHIENLVNTVKENSIDVGFAFDGDADRCIAVTKSGKVVDGDGILFVLARYFDSRKKLKGRGIVATQLSNGGLISSLKKCGITTAVCDVGDRQVAEKLSQTGYCLGGEQSGHIIASMYENTGDGLVTAILLMEAIIESEKSLEELLSDYHPLSRITKNYVGRRNLQLLSQIMQSYKNIRVILRNSGTEDVVRLIVEGESEEICKSAVKQIEGILCAE